MSKIKIGFSGLTVVKQVERARNIHNSINGNLNFPSPLPLPAVFNTAINALETAWNESRNRDTVKIQIMKLRRAELLELVVQLAAYVQSTSNGDKEIILSSGFDVMQRGAPQPPMGKVQNLRASNGTVLGSIKLLWDKMPNAKMYIIQISPNPFTEETFKLVDGSTKTRFQIEGLTSAGKYWMRVAAFGKDGFGIWSDLVWEIAK